MAVASGAVVEAEPVFEIAVPLAMVVPLHAVANDMGSPEDWKAVEAWAATVGLVNAAQALAAIAKQLSPRDATTVDEWTCLLGARASGLVLDGAITV